MAEDTTIQVAETKRTENYAVYDSPDGDERQAVVGTYISDGVADQIGEFAALGFSEDGDGLAITLDRETGNYAVFSSEADAIETLYLSHETVEEMGFEETPESLSVEATLSDEETFEEALEAVTVDEEDTAEEEDALLSGESDEDAESEAESEEDEEVTISDEEAGLVGESDD